MYYFTVSESVYYSYLNPVLSATNAELPLMKNVIFTAYLSSSSSSSIYLHSEDALM